MRELFPIWWRAFSIVTCTALNATQIFAGHYGAAFCTGSLLSFIWWSNTRKAARSDVATAQWAYAFGAGCGTVTGMWLGRLWG
jgi:hypothetical protein